MRLSQRTEWIIVGALIAYLAFTPGFQVIRDLLATPIGKAVALAGIVYVWKYVSVVIAVLLLVGYIRCAKTGVWEGLTNGGGNVSCTCTEGFNYDPLTGKCKNIATGASIDPISCTCPAGYSYDSVKHECAQSSSMSEPIPPIATVPPAPPPLPSPNVPTPVVAPIEMTPSGAAPAVSTGPVTSNAPMTTPSAANDAIKAAMPPDVVQGPMPSEGFSSGYSMY